jgi:probable F420-dependent oxidoreductase
MSIYLIAGRVKPTPQQAPGYTFVGQAIPDAEDAERFGFRRVFLSERHDLKNAGAILGGVAARTSRLEIGTGAISLGAGSRHPKVTAGFASTMQAAYGQRFILGVGRGDVLDTCGMMSYERLVEQAELCLRLWRGEKVSCQWSPETRAEFWQDDPLEVSPPQIWFFTIAGGPKAARAAANPIFDGVVLTAFLSPDAVSAAVDRLRTECERIGRDPATLRICHCLPGAPELDDLQTRALCHGRLVTYLEWRGYGEPIAKANGWDLEVLDRLRDHKSLKSLSSSGMTADQAFHRVELLEAAEVIPEEWVRDVCAIGSVDEAVKKIESYRNAGADETIIYGPTPAQSEKLIKGWRGHREVGTRLSGVA